MMSSKEAIASIACRFNAEILDIQQHVNFLESKTAIHVIEVDQHNEVLRSSGLDELPTRDHLGLPPHELSDSEIGQLVQAFERISPTMDRAQRELGKRFDSIPYLDGTEELVACNAELLSEWTDYAIAHLPDNPTTDDIDNLRNYIDGQPDTSDDDESISDSERSEIIDEGLRRGARYKIETRLFELQDLTDRFREIEVIARSKEPDANTGVYRQSFIALMAAFDAAVFDLVEIALRSRFFELADAFGDDKVKIQEIVDKGSFPAFRDEVIEQQLRKRYVRDLLGLLRDKWGVECVDERDGAKHEYLIELIRRRNVHLHNRGIVDDEYMKMNLYRMKLGQYALIDESYWQTAKLLTTYCVRQITTWAITAPSNS